jgi:flavodoxin
LVQSKALIVYDTRYGNTEKIARSLESGLNESGVPATLENVRSLTPESLSGFGLLCFGAPTEGFGASKPMKDYVGRLAGSDFAGKLGFVFDTKLDSRFSGSAAKYIENHLTGLGLKMAAPRESAIVTTVRKGAAIAGAALREGEEERFFRIGKSLGARLGVKLPLPASS